MRSRVMAGALALLIGMSAVGVSAQSTAAVRGTVRDAQTSQPVAGAQVVIGAAAATTNARGEYSLATGAGPRLVRVSRIGYAPAQRTIEVAAGAEARADFALVAAVVALDELVVTGQPDATRRRAIGTSVATIDAEELPVPVSSLGQLLQGRAAGVTSYAASGTAGSAGVLNLRGATSINESNSPVVYVDGVRVDGSEKPLFYFSLGGQSTSRLNDISPADIERVEVVKGAAASALYGSQASQGVIQIFTKKGRPGTSTMTASVNVGGSRIPSVFPLLHPDSKYPNPNDLIENGTFEQYSLALRGGVDRVRHYVSVGYQREDGSFPTNAYERANGRVNLWLMPFENVTAELNSGLSWSRTEMPFNDSFSLGVLYNTLLGNPAVRGTTANPYGSPLVPVDYTLSVTNVDQTYRFTQGVTLKHEAGPLTQRAVVGLDVVNGTGVTRWPYAPNIFLPRGGRWMAQRDNMNANFEYNASLETRVTDGIESVLSAGGQLYAVRDRRVYSVGSDFPAPGLELLGATTAGIEVDEEVLDYTTGGLFVQEQLGFGDRFFLVGGIRVDGSSAFGEDFGLQPYPKVSASYIVSEEPWFALPGVNSLRLRGGFGMAGTQPGAFDAMRTYSPFAANGGQPAIHAEALGNPNLAPEVSHEWEGGLDATLLDGRLELDATGYHQTTHDAILSRASAPSLGFLTAQLVNVGEVRNRGLELSAAATLVETADLSWSLSASYGYNQNEVLELGGATPLTADPFFGTRVVEGYPLGGKWQFVQKEVGADGLPVRADTAHYLGTGLPPHTGGFGAKLGYGALQLFANAQWAAGHVITNRTRADMIRNRTGKEYFDLVIANGDNPTAPTSIPVRSLVARGGMLGEFTERGDWLKLREVSAAYSIPGRLSRVVGSERATITVSGRNLFTATRYGGADPEVAGTLVTPPSVPQPYFVPGNRQFATFAVGNDYFTVPQTRQVTVGLDLQF